MGFDCCRHGSGTANVLHRGVGTNQESPTPALSQPRKHQALDPPRRGEGEAGAVRGYDSISRALGDNEEAMGHRGPPSAPTTGRISEQDPSGKSLTVDFDEVGEVGEEERQLFPGQQVLLLHPLVEEEVEDSEDAEVRPFSGKELCGTARRVEKCPGQPRSAGLESPGCPRAAAHR